MKITDKEGFTLIELLIVVAIIGIIAAIAIPNLLTAIQRSKQKRSVADIRSLGNVVESYAVDFNAYPGTVDDGTETTAVSGLDTYLETTYIQNLPTVDGWDYDIQYDATKSAYTIYSKGRDGSKDGSWTNTETKNFENDIVFKTGAFYQKPGGPQS